MLINKKNIRKLEKLVEKKLKKAYRSNCYFYVDNVMIQFQDLEGMNDINCVAGYEITENGEKTGKYHQIHFTFNMVPEVVKSTKEHAAVLALYAMNELDGYSSFEIKN